MVGAQSKTRKGRGGDTLEFSLVFTHLCTVWKVINRLTALDNCYFFTMLILLGWGSRRSIQKMAASRARKIGPPQPELSQFSFFVVETLQFSPPFDPTLTISQKFQDSASWFPVLTTWRVLQDFFGQLNTAFIVHRLCVFYALIQITVCLHYFTAQQSLIKSFKSNRK